MDTPICVFDAQTFVEHIHEIKVWFYGGHLRLVVPTSTSENVEQLYKKSIEPKPTPQEPPRPKSASKPARKVNPAFDINPAVAKEFLARLRKGKEEEQNDKEKSLCYEDERWAAVNFQASNEDYTPWKDIPVEEPKPVTSDDRPLSWAELAKKKLQAEGVNERAQGLKGPAKPKLVSKATGQDSSPWKMQNNLPKISATQVPVHLRPLMSCALWRLHESINRNDLNQLFLLTDLQEIRIIAEKLRVTVVSSKELGQKIAALMERPDLNVTGMLEKEGLAKHKEEVKTVASETLREATDSGHVSSTSHDLQPGESQIKENGHTEVGTKSLKVDEHASQEIPSNGYLHLKKPIEATQLEKPVSESPSKTAMVGIDPRELVQSILKTPMLQAQIQHSAEEIKVEDATSKEQEPQNAKEMVQTTPDQIKSEPTNSNGPLPAASIAKTPDRSANQPIPATQNDLDDSDEEVVVFVPNPKRMSAQKRAAASSSRPTTSHSHPVVSPKTDSPRTEIIDESTSNVQQQPAETEPSNIQKLPRSRQRPLSSGPGLYDPDQRSTKPPVTSHGHPRPLSSGPTLIDPNAFGRGLTPNTTPGVLTNVSATRKSRHHSPRTSIQGPTLQPNRSSAQSSPQTSPPRQKNGRSPRRSPRATPQKREDSPPAAIPVISHQAFTRAPLVAPNAPNVQKSRFGPIGPPSKSSSNLDSLTTEIVPDINGTQSLHQAPIQRPRSANGPGKEFAPVAPFARNQSPRSPRPPKGPVPPPSGAGAGAQPSQRTVKKSLFEPELDVTTAQPEPEPRGVKMPEVQYTLKSGMTREAARGKGKLWVG